MTLAEQLREASAAARAHGLTWEKLFDSAAREIEGHVRETARLRARLFEAHEVQRGDVWYFQGDGEDNLESLVCPVVIQPDELARILKLATRCVLCAGCGTRYHYIPGVDERERLEHDRIARERHYQCAPKEATDG